jgi:ferritin-like metal-binding protein YciE
MAKAAQSQELKAAFELHETETEEHVARLEKVFKEIDETPSGKTCDAIMGIVEEGQEVMKGFEGAPALDAGLLAAAQAVEHYEIARYGTLKTWAGELGLNEAVKLLEMTLGEEKKTDEALTKLAQSEVNRHAQAALRPIASHSHRGAHQRVVPFVRRAAYGVAHKWTLRSVRRRGNS